MFCKIKTTGVVIIIMLSAIVLVGTDNVKATTITDHTIIPHDTDWSSYNSFERQEWIESFSDIKIIPIYDNLPIQHTVGYVIFSFVPTSYTITESSTAGGYHADLFYTISTRVILDPDTPLKWDNYYLLGIKSVDLSSTFNDPYWNELPYNPSDSSTNNYNNVYMHNDILNFGHSTLYGKYWYPSDNLDFAIEEEINTEDDVNVWYQEMITPYLIQHDQIMSIQDSLSNVQSVLGGLPYVGTGLKASGYLLNIIQYAVDQSNPGQDYVSYNQLDGTTYPDYNTAISWTYDAPQYDYMSVITTSNWMVGHLSIDSWDYNEPDINHLFSIDIDLESDRGVYVDTVSYDYEITLAQEYNNVWSLPTIPKPEIISADSITDTSLQLSWEETPLDHLFQKYKVYVSTDPNFTPTSISIDPELKYIGGSDKTITQCQISNLNPYTTYYCTVLVETKESDSITNMHRYEISDTYEVTTNTLPPTSTLSISDDQWRSTSPLIISCIASSPVGAEIKHVSLYYSYSVDGVDWGTWTPFTPDLSPPYEWDFDWPAGDGYYKFDSVAVDLTDNPESPPAIEDGDLIYGYDITPPSTPTTCLFPTSDIQTSGTTAPVTFRWSSATDTLSGPRDYRLWVDDDPNFGSLNIDILVSDNQYPTSLARDTWYWKVCAVDNAGNEGAWSSPDWSFSIYTPSSSSPASVSGHVYIAGTSIGISGATVITTTPLSQPSDPTLFSSGGGYATSSVLTGPSGEYSLSISSGSTYHISATKDGYTSQTRIVYVSPGGMVVDFALSDGSSMSTGGGDVGCLLPGTAISTPDGSVNIEDIRKGDIVLSYNEWTGEVEPKTVYHTTIHTEYAGYIEINDRLRITANHPVYTTKGTVEAGDLRVGDLMITFTGTESIMTIEEMPELVTVYNFEVEGNHNYYADGILVHNVAKIDIPECPYLYVWDGTQFVEENNILPQATNPHRDELDVVDNYMIQGDLHRNSGIDTYSVLIKEDMLEKTYLDRTQLAIVDYDDSGITPVMTPDGHIMTINAPLSPISCMDDSESNITDLIDELDDGYRHKAEHNDTLIINFPAIPEYNEAKLVISHYAIMELLPYDVPIDIRRTKCSIHLQTMNELGEWVDFDSVPARKYKVIDCIDITPLEDIINTGQPIRLLITGTHVIDFIGLDISNSSDLDIRYVTPSYSSYMVPYAPDISSKVQCLDQDYITISPGEGIELAFPYLEQIKANRAFGFISDGHYFTLPEIAIEQPVTMTATIPSDVTDGTVYVYLEEKIDISITRILQGQTIDLSTYQDGDIRIPFVQDTLRTYQLHAWIENGNGQSIDISFTLQSFRGSQSIDLSLDQDGRHTTYLLDDVLWNISGASFNKISGRYEILKDSLIQFDLNEYYRYDISDNGTYDWTFGDGTWTSDIRPTHVYDMPGIYPLGLIIMNATDEGWPFFSQTNIEVVLSPPVAQIEVYQEVNINLEVAGRKDNTVTLEIYEDGELIHQLPVTRTSGQPDKDSIVFNKYLDRTYEIKLVYDAEHKGVNNAWLILESGDSRDVLFFDFESCTGKQQDIVIDVDTICLDNVLQENIQYFFDASDSYDIDGVIVSYAWDFGDGSIVTGMLVEHTFEDFEAHTITLVVTDNDGAVNEVEYVLSTSGSIDLPIVIIDF